MPHLPGKPEKVYALANVSGGECVAGLVRVTVSNASFFEGWHPCFYSYRVGVRPGLTRFGIAENKLAFHESELFLRLQRGQRLAV